MDDIDEILNEFSSLPTIAIVLIIVTVVLIIVAIVVQSVLRVRRRRQRPPAKPQNQPPTPRRQQKANNTVDPFEFGETAATKDEKPDPFAFDDFTATVVTDQARQNGATENKESSADAFCPFCGAPREPGKFCPFCGNKYDN